MPPLTVANVIGFFDKTFLNFSITPLLYIINQIVKRHPDLLPVSTNNQLISLLLDSKTTSILKVLTWITVIRKINSWLSYASLNNWTNLFEEFEPANEIAVVTGGSSGIGKLTVLGLSKAGLKKIVVMDIQPMTYEAPPNVVYYKVDLTSGKDIESVAEQIKKEVGDATVVINNAGTGIGKTILGSTERSIKLTFNVNSVAPFLVTKAFLPMMIQKNKGHIVTIASLASYTTPAQMVDYAASKAAALSFSEGLSQELRHRYSAPGVRNTVVHPMWVKTPLTSVFKNMDHILSNQLEPEQVSDAVVNQVLKGKSAQILIPSSLGISCLLRALPNWIQEKMRDDMADMVVVNKDF